jgi:hypothetical protein
VKDLAFTDAELVTQGDMLAMTDAKAGLAATGDTTLVGAPPRHGALIAEPNETHRIIVEAADAARPPGPREAQRSAS